MFHLLRRLYIIQVFTKSLTHEIKCDEGYRGANGADNQAGGRDAVDWLERDKEQTDKHERSSCKIGHRSRDRRAEVGTKLFGSNRDKNRPIPRRESEKADKQIKRISTHPM